MSKKNRWLEYSEETKNNVMNFADDYMQFMNKSKTERETAANIEQIAIENGFINAELCRPETIRKVGKFYFTNHGKGIALFNIRTSLERGLKIVGSHIDSPRIDVKANPLMEHDELAYLDTHYYGGIKKYQWVTMPLAIHGVVCFTDGTKKDVVIGEAEDDPVFCITDLLPHLASDQMDKNARKLFEGEALDLLIGSIPDAEDEKTQTYMVKILKANGYIKSEEDFISAELEIVPAGKARNCGIDKSMIMAYGQDDKVCAFSSLRAIIDAPEAETNMCALFVDKEEIGSVGNTGMESDWFIHRLHQITKMFGSTDTTETVNKMLENSDMLSADVDAAYDPMFAGAYDKQNACCMGHGVGFAKFTGSGGKSGSNDANAEYVAKIRRIMNDNDVAYQFAELGKVGQGGGGTIAYILANKCVNVIDCGTGVLNMHAPWEITSKSDVWETYSCYKAFLKSE